MKSWIQYFYQLVFFQLAQVLYFFLEMIGRSPIDLMHLSFWVNMSKEIQNLCITERKHVDTKIESNVRFTNNF